MVAARNGILISVPLINEVGPQNSVWDMPSQEGVEPLRRPTI